MEVARPRRPREPTEALFFDARLRPHRSLSRRGFLLLMIAVATAACLAGLACLLIGAWPVAVFLGLEVALVYRAFKINYRHGRLYETLRLTRGELTVARVSHRGARKTWRFQPAWLQVLIDDPPNHDSQLVLRSHGKSLSIGRFLTPEERAELAAALRRALEKARAATRPSAQPSAQPSAHPPGATCAPA